MQIHDTTNNVKLCECGCGEQIPQAKYPSQQRRFVKSHRVRLQYDPLIERFWRQVDKRGPNECWEWQGARIPRGYGRIVADKVIYATHRLSYELHNGSIPDGLVVCHSCDNPPCCNPNHLWLGTSAENTHDRDAKGRGAQLRGEESGASKITEEAVRDIRRRYANGTIREELAREYGVSVGNISHITLYHTWRHVT